MRLARRFLKWMFVLLPILVSAQQWEWAKGFDGDLKLHNLDQDSEGNIYLTGYAGWNRLYFFDKPINGMPSILKCNPDGKLIWHADIKGDINLGNIIFVNNHIWIAAKYFNNSVIELDSNIILPHGKTGGENFGILILSAEGKWEGFKLLATNTGGNGAYRYGFSIYPRIIKFPNGISLASEMTTDTLRTKNLAIIKSSNSKTEAFVAIYDDNFNCISLHNYSTNQNEDYYTRSFSIFKDNLKLNIGNAAIPKSECIYTIDFSGVLIDSSNYGGNLLLNEYDSKDDFQYYQYYILDSMTVEGTKYPPCKLICLYKNSSLQWIKQVNETSVFIGKLFNNSLAFHLDSYPGQFDNIKLSNSVGRYFGEINTAGVIKYLININFDLNINALISAQNGKIILSGNIDKANTHKIGSITISKEFNNWIGKFNTLKLQFKNIPFCGFDSIYATADTAYKSFKWRINDTLNISGPKFRISTYAGEKYKVELYSVTQEGTTGYYWDSVTSIHSNIHAYFNHRDSVACQWTKCFFTDSSWSDTVIQGIQRKYLWKFGDGKTDTAAKPVHIFSDTGRYSVSMTVWNGPCTDSYTLPYNIRVIPAPKPGIKVSAIFGCVPLPVNFTDSITGSFISRQYFLNDTLLDSTQKTILFKKPGTYALKQVVRSSNGCQPDDSVIIRVVPSLSSNDKINVFRTSVTQSGNVIQWFKDTIAVKYAVFRNSDGGEWILQTTVRDNAFTDSTAELSVHEYHYKVKGIDTCGNFSSSGTEGWPITLKADYSGWDYVKLSWSEYSPWRHDAGTYILQSRLEGENWKNVISGKTHGYSDPTYIDTIEREICYRVITPGPDTSFSNTICMNFDPELWIPNAFTPNFDGVNDNFRIFGRGILSFHMIILDRRYGQVFSTDDFRNYWDGNFKGKPAIGNDVYIYVIHAKTRNGNIYKRGNVTLIRG